MPRKLTAFMTLLLVFTLLAAGCSKSGGATPTATAKAFYDAAKAKDVQTLKSSMSKKSLEVMESFAKMGGKTLDETLKEPSNMPPAFEARNEKITGDTATLEVKGQGDKWDTLYFVKEDGRWKIAFDKAMENSMRDAGPTTGPDLPPPTAPMPNTDK
jgi:hypothetical protein